MGYKRLSISCWVIAYTLCVGIPVWWATTTLERPTIEDLPDVEFNPLPVTFNVAYITTDPAQVSLESLKATLRRDAENIAKTGNRFPQSIQVKIALKTIHSKSLAAIAPPKDSHIDHTRLEAQVSGQLPDEPGHLNVFLIASVGPSAAINPVAWLSTSRSAWVWLPGKDLDTVSRCSLQHLFYTVLHGANAANQPHKPTPQHHFWQLPISSASELTAIFTLAIPQPPEGVQNWNIEQPLQAVWAPIQHRLSPLLSLRLESQQRLLVQGRMLHGAYHTPDNTTALRAADAPFFVDSDAWALESGRITAGHVHPLAPESHHIPEALLHFVGYVPAPDERPLAIACGPSATCPGFTVNEWGGVTFLNSPASTGPAEELDPGTVALFLGLAVQQLREALGLPGAADAVWESPRCKGGVHTASPGGHGVSLWELDLLLRHRFVELMTQTNQAIRTLVELVAALDTLEIPSFIGDKVGIAQRVAVEASEASEIGEYYRACRLARRARTHAEVALSHHSIASHHNYPPQHKVALYLPFFAPLSLPLLMTVVREVRRVVIKPLK